MDNKNGSHGDYKRFFAMIGASMLVMYGLTYLNSFQIIEHAWFSETRLYMTMMMGAGMIVIMLGFMLGMYPSRLANTATFAFAAVLFAAGLFLVRSQSLVDDADYMEGMIPHHSIAILTSERAGIEDLRVRRLADDIIEAQRREIEQMEWLIEDIRQNGPATTRSQAEARRLPSF